MKFPVVPNGEIFAVKSMLNRELFKKILKRNPQTKTTEKHQKNDGCDLQFELACVNLSERNTH